MLFHVLIQSFYAVTLSASAALCYSSSIYCPDFVGLEHSVRRLAYFLMTFSLVFMFTAPSYALVSTPDGEGKDLFEMSGSVLGWKDTISVPVPSDGLLFKELSSHSNFVVGLDTDSQGWAWGRSANGNIGAFNTQTSYVDSPQPLIKSAENREHIGGVTLTAASTNTFYIDKEHLVWGFGKNTVQNGEIGNPDAPSTNHDAVPVLKEDGSQLKATKVYGGEQYALAIGEDGYAYTWGQALQGRLGRDTNDVPSSVASPVVDAKGKPQRFVTAALGYNTVLATAPDGTLWGWGNASNGLLGPTNTKSAYDNPQQVFLDKAGTTPARFSSISLSDSYALALDSSHRTWAWGTGSNECAVLGVAKEKPGVTINVPTPVVDDQGKQVSFTQVAATPNQPHASAGLDKDGRIWTWGCSEYLGRTDSARMAVVKDQDDQPLEASAVYPAYNAMFGLLKEPLGTGASRYNLVGWGNNDDGVVLGNPDVAANDFALTPVPIRLSSPVYEGIVYFGDDDSTGQTGTTADGMMTVTVPDHKAGRIPVYVSWPQLGAERELIGYYTYMLDPTISVSSKNLPVGDTAIFSVTVPAAERPYIGDAEMSFSVADDQAASQIAPFEDGVASLRYQGTIPGPVDVTAVANADAGQTTVSPVLSESTQFGVPAGIRVEEGYQDQDGNFVDYMEAIPDQPFPVTLKISNTQEGDATAGLISPQITVSSDSEPQMSQFDCQWDAVETADGSSAEGIQPGSSVLCQSSLSLSSGQSYQNTVNVTAQDVDTLEQVSDDDVFRAKALTAVLPVEPTVSTAVCGFVPELEIPEVEGLNYKVTVVKDDANSKDLEVEATARPGYLITPEDAQSSWSFHLVAEECPLTPPPGPGTTLPPAATEVTPKAPSLSTPACGERPIVNLPYVKGIEYATSQNGDEVTVNALAKEGFVLAPGSEAAWVLDAKVTPCEQTQPPAKTGTGGSPLASTGAALGSLLISAVTFIGGFALLMVSRRKTN